MNRRVVVTGMGTVNPLGNTVNDFWAAIKAGENGIGKLTRFESNGYSSKVAGEVKDFVPEKVLEAKEARRMDRFTQFAVVASLEAMTDAKLAVGDTDPERFGIILGNGIGGIETLETQCRRIIEKGPKSVHPLFVPMMIANEAPGNVAIRLKAFGPCPVRGHRVRFLQRCPGRRLASDPRRHHGRHAGRRNRGAVDGPGLPGFCSLQAVSTRNDEPDKASRPFDRDRDGFVMAEGPVSSCWRSWSTRARGAPASWRRLPATGPPATRTTSPPRTRRAGGPSRP